MEAVQLSTTCPTPRVAVRLIGATGVEQDLAGPAGAELSETHVPPALLALISLPAALQSGSPIIIVGWIAQTFLQLVLLPIIIVGQNVQAATSDARAESDHETLISIHTLTSEVHSIAEQQTKILEILDERTNPVKG